MKREELDTLRTKVDELRAVLLFGKRALPFLEDIFAFVREIIPVVEELKASVDATSEKLPHASKQLDKVTHATEIASTEILNTLETMFGKLEELTTHHNNEQARSARLHETAAVVDDALRALASGPTQPADIAHVAKVWNEHRLHQQTASANDYAATLEGLKTNCTSIMMALQVQDITAQQIAGVNRLMQSVDEALSRLMEHFSEVGTTADPNRFKHARLDIQFDAAAEFVGVEERQRAADDLIESARSAAAAEEHGNGQQQ